MKKAAFTVCQVDDRLKEVSRRIKLGANDQKS
jgi:hypothetical protein